MPRPRNAIPKFSIDKTGRAFTKVNGRFVSLGRGDTPEARERYAAVLTEQLSGQVTGEATERKRPVTLNELLLKYATEALPRFSESERHCQRTVIRLARRLFGDTAVAEFGPLKLRVLRNAMVAGDPNETDSNGKPKPRKPWSRNTVNRQVKRLRAMIRWGVSWEMVSPSVVHSLETVPSLTAAETTAKESKPRLAVPDEDFAAVRKVLREKHRDVLDLLSLTGARPGELLKLTTGMIERTGPVWRCELAEHKTAHKGLSRVLFFNSAAQLILRKYLVADPDVRLFKMRRDNFGHVIQRACDRAGVTRFCPHQMRHTAATRLVDQDFTEGAQRLLGHSNATMTEHYSRRAEKLAIEAAKKLG